MRIFDLFRKRGDRRAVVEELEPRILYSADLNPVAAAEPQGTITAEVRTLDGGVDAQHAALAVVSVQEERSREIVFVDVRVENAEQLVAGITANAASGRDIEVIQLDANRDGIAQMLEALQGQSGIDAIHLIGEGTTAELHLGGTFLTQTGINGTYAEQLRVIGQSLSAEADILIYGCNFGAGEAGQVAMQALAQLTGADIAASTDRTGHASEFGDWDLEATTGTIETDVVVSAEAQAAWEHALATYTVTNTDDSGAGSLRQAITDANSNAGADIISFNIAGTGVHTINVLSTLTVDGTVTIDATTDDSFAANGNRPAIILDGNNAFSGNGLVLTTNADGSVVRGLVIRDFTGDGIEIQNGSNNNTIAGNYIGSLSEIGAIAAGEGNTANGILVRGANNTIGGLTALDRNVLSGNLQGIQVNGAGGTGNLIIGNYVGTDATGLLDVGNTDDGIEFDGGANGNTVGGATVAERNVISGNNDDGFSTETNSNVVQGNYIGVGADGTTAIGNSSDGVELWGNASSNRIGGTAAGQGNLIAYNGGDGIFVSLVSGTPSGNSLLGNSISANGNLGIDLGAGGVTSNDLAANMDSDTGANNLQNFPVITRAVTNATNRLAVGGTLNSIANTVYRIEIFSNVAGDTSGNGEGQTYLGFVNVRTDGSGNATWGTAINANVAVGVVISATATRLDAALNPVETSEFAGNVTTVNQTLIVTNTTDTINGTITSVAALIATPGGDGISLREAITAANNDTMGIDLILFNIAGVGPHQIDIASALPTIGGSLVIDGTTEPNYSAGTPVVRVDGAAAGFSGISIGAAGDGSTIRGLMITGFTLDGINVASDADNVAITDNWIGTAGTGTSGHGIANVGNSDDGIEIAGSNALILRNVVNNNNDEGIDIKGSGVTGHVIQGNYIGLDPDGSTSVNGNNDVGIAVYTGSGNTIGGSTAAARNVISMNNEGIEIRTSNNVVQGNYIGTDAGGTSNKGNRIGSGVEIQNSSTGNQIGGTAADAGNLIAYNDDNGVDVVDGSGHLILGNAIHSNGLLGINLGTAGVTANDAAVNMDSDTGANNLQNFPVLTSATSNAAGTTIVGTFNSNAGTTYRIEFFANRPTVADSPNGEGERYLGAITVTTDGSGNASVNTTLANVWVNSGDRVTATATVQTAGPTYGSTSEFAANVTATSTGIIVVDTTSDAIGGTTTSITNLGNNRGADGRISLREAITAANNTANGGTPDKIVFAIPVTDANHYYYRDNGTAGTFATAVTTRLADAQITDFDADYLAGTARSWYRISLSGNYLDVTQAVIIDGSTQAGYSVAAGPVIEINAAGITTAGDENAIALTSGASTIRGLVINSAPDNAIEIDVNANNSVIVGNYIGTDVSGTQARGNATLAVYGALALKADGVVIGGTTAADRNVISGNTYYGIEIYSSATGNSIRGNYIGTRADGSGTLGNGLSGIYLQGSALNNTIGGITADQANRIANNGGDGVWVGATAGAGNAILGNAIYSNTGLAIDLGANGVTANDVPANMDSDSGVNNLQNFPVLTSAAINGTQITIVGSLNSNANSYYRIEFFASASGDGTGYGEGQTYLGFVNVATDASGNATIDAALSATVSVGAVISATATRSDATYSTFTDTSEFALNVTAVVNTAPVLNNLAGDSLAYSEGAGAVVIEQGSNATVSDADSANFNTGTLTVSFTAGSDSAEDVLAIRNQGTGAGQIGVSGSNVTFGGVTIGSFTGGSGGANLVVTFNASSTPAAAQALVRNITYQNTDTGAPTTGARTVRFVLTDGDGGTSTNQNVTVTVSGVNDAPTGAPVVTGTPTEDQVLGVNTGSIADADGLGAFSYQWQRNGSNIVGATASTYTLGDADVGTNVRVVVSYTDARGTAESLTSAAVGPIANVNDAPTGAPVVTGTPTEDQVLSVNTGTIADADGLGAFSYQWQRNGVNIVGATSSTYTLGDADVSTNIRVVVSYTDVRGTAESLTSAAVGPIANVNDAPTGAPVVTGTPTEDQILTANTATIADADGLGAFSYQWQRNGVNIVGATGSTYTLGDADVGTNIRVVVSYTDARGTAESLTSAAVGPIANVNDAPTGAPVVTGTPTEDQVLGVNTGTIADADGLGAFSYQWQRNGVNIVGATGSTYTLGDADVGTNVRVVVSYTDVRGTAESLTSAAVGPIANVNDAPSGAPVVTGTPTEDQVLGVNTATIADADGLGAFSYQWQRNGVNIVGATGSTYTLGDADVGTNVRVVVSYTDVRGTAESLTSAAVGPIANVNDAPSGAPVVTGTPTEDQVLGANTATIADADGLGAFSYQWQRNGVNIVGATGSTYTLGDADVGTNIRVVVSYTDARGTAESLTSAAVGPIANVNDAPTGGPVVTGTPTEDQILTANTATIADADGLGAFSYQWQRNGVNIVGATASTYTLGDADVSTNIRVVVSYTDARGTAESLTSAAVGPVANLNDAPSGAPAVTGTPTEDQVLGVNTGTIADADGLGAFSYQWQRNGVNIVGATGSTYTLGDADVGTNIRVVVSYTDARGTAESLTSAAVGPVANLNDAPSGAPAVTGTPTEDQVLGVNTGTIADADGLGAFSYQWQRNGVNIVGATSSTYTLGDADVSTNVRVVVSYTDARGTAESLTSAAVGPVANLNDAPSGAPAVTGTPTEDQVLGVNTGTIDDADGLGAFSYQWQRNGVNIVGATGSTYTLGDADVGTNVRVVVSYTDARSTAESLTSAAVGPIANVNDAPSGAPVVTGTPTEDQVLGVNTGSIADADGLGAFSYQWQRNGSNIVGATATTYTLGDADVGTNVRVVVSYTDARGTAESLTSAAVGPIANVNDAPSGAPVVMGTPTENQTLTADTTTLADADGLGAFSYQWQRNGSNIVGATSSTYTLGATDVGTNIRVIVSYTDVRGTAESLTSAAVGPVGNVNEPPTGAPVVTGTPTEDQVLTANTATIADADGLGTFNYQWQRNGVNIGGANGSTYTLGDADVGTNIRVVVSYTDGNGTAESLTSVAVGPIANVNDAPSGAPVVTGTATEDQVLGVNTSSIADADGLGVFSYQWQRNGVNIVGGTASTYTLSDADVGTNIRVVVSYIDGQGTAESLTSVAVGLVANLNDAPTGAPVVTGTPTEDQILTANTATIADADGLGAFSYQWQRNGVNIVGATGSTYTLGDADVGTNIRVVVSYTDARGTAESLTSAAVGPIANVNDAPTGAPVVTGTPTEDQVLGVNTGTIADADGLGAFSYQWQRNGVNIVGATGSTYTLGDADVGTNVRVVVSYTDVRGTAESLTSAAVGPIANVNDAPSGAPVVTGTPTEDQVLGVNTATIADADGLGAFSYQWQRNGVNIVGATGSTYTLGDADVGTNVRVVVSYTDVRGTAESLTSAAVGPIANVNDAPSGAPVVTGTPTEDQVLGANTATIADADGLGAFSYQWQRNGVNIVGATGSTYTLGDADVGTNIRVVVSYTDARGTAESLTSAAVGPIANVNDAPTGGPVVTGTPTEDQILTANTATIADADGLGAFSYQWQRNGVNIVGATASTYTLGDADVSTNIRVVVSYTDARGTAESLTSAAVGPVANLNDAPSGAPAVTGTPTEDQVLGVNTGTIADADGLGAFSYQWQRNGVNIVGATGSTYTLGDADVGTNIRVVVSYTDARGTAESLTSAAVGPVANLNDAPSGAPAVTGTPTEDQVLGVNTGTIADADGLGAFSYQWQRNGVNIVGATSSTYTLGDADVSTNVRVVVSYTDARGTAESLTSAAVGPVANLNDAPSGAPAVTGTPTEDQVLGVNTGTIDDADGLGAFSYQWQRDGVSIIGATGSTYTLGDADVGTNVRVVVSYTDVRGTAESLTSVAVGPIANLNDAPTGAPAVTGTATEDQILAVDTASIADPDGLGTFSYQWQRNGSNIVGATATTYTLGDADVGTNVRVVVSYTDARGTAESLTSAAVGPIANVNDAPSGAPVVTGTPTEDQVLGVNTGTIADADGLGAFSYQWQRNGVNIVGATGSTYTLGDADVGTNIRVVVSYTDARGTAESLTSAAVGPIANVNDAPSGAPVVTGTPTEDQVLTANTATIADADGLGAFSYQWQRNGVNIVGATSSTYTLGDADVSTNVRVVVSYTDARGTAESLTSAAVGPIANVNDAPSGAPVVTGTPTEDQILTANTATIADADGLGAFSYQWQRNGVNIVGATGSTYTLGDADVGTNIRVVVSYTDVRGTAESLTSAAVGPIANVNDAPVVTSNGGGGTASLNAAENQTATTTVTVTDVDGGTAVYSIVPVATGGAADAALFSIDSNTGVLTFNAAPNFEAPTDAGGNNVYDVTVQVADGNGGFDTQIISVTVTNVNEAPTGATLIGGAVAENAPAGTIVATVSGADPDAAETLAYSLVDDAGGRFAVNPVSGQITVTSAVQLDFETAASHRVVVRVTDAGGLSGDQAIVVAVGDVSDTTSAIGGAAPIDTWMQPSAPQGNGDSSPNTQTIGSLSFSAAIAENTSTAAKGSAAIEERLAAGLRVEASEAASRQTVAPLRIATLELREAPVQPVREGFQLVANVFRRQLTLYEIVAFSPAFQNAETDEAVLEALGWKDGKLTLVSSFGIARGTTVSAGAVVLLGDSADESIDLVKRSFFEDPVRFAGTVFAAGFVWWASRSWGLIATLAMGLPAWRHVDFLPILAKDDEEDEDEDDALEAPGELDESSPETVASEELFAHMIGSNAAPGGRPGAHP